MDKHKSAMYQRDIMYQFKDLCDVTFYGPGFKSFNPSEKIKDTVNKLGGADLIIFGHSWLNDYPGIEADPYPKLEIEDCSLPKVAILNKEYRNLESKLSWIKEKKFLCAFSHHIDANIYEKKTNVPFKFIPFGFSENLFKRNKQIKKSIDFAFSGILQNSNFGNLGQSDARIKVMKRLYHCIGDVPVLKRYNYKKYNFFWNGIPRNKLDTKIATLLGKYKYLNDEEYANLHHSSRTFLNSLSPFGLVSPRFYECMASKSLVFCEQNKIVEQIIPTENFISFQKDFSDFDEKIEFALGDGEERLKIINNALEFATSKCTYKILVNNMLDFISDKLN